MVPARENLLDVLIFNFIELVRTHVQIAHANLLFLLILIGFCIPL